MENNDLKYYQESNFIEKNKEGKWCLCTTLDINDVVQSKESDLQDKVINNNHVTAANVAQAHSIKDSVFDMDKYGYEDTLLMKDLPMAFLEGIVNSGFTILFIEEFNEKSKDEVKVMIAEERLEELRKEAQSSLNKKTEERE